MKFRDIFIIAVPIAILALALLLGSILLLRLFFVTALISIIGYLWTILSVRNLIVSTGKPPLHLQVGDTFQREIVLTNPGRIPRLWLKLHDNTNLPGHRDTTMVNVMGKQAHLWQTTFTCQKRGHYHLGPTTITTTDPFGIFRHQRILGQEQGIIVYPATVDLPLFRFASFSDFGYGSGYQSISHISPNASSVRQYASGDSLHHIHWRSTARTGSLMVKMFDADRSYNASKTAWILLDMNEESHFGREGENSDEYAITIAASLVRKYLQGGMRVGMIASDDRRYFAPAERGEEHLWEILEVLALMKSDWKTKLNEIVSQHLDSFRDNPLVIIVATSMTEGLMDTVHQLKNRVDSLVVVLLDIDSFKGRPSGVDTSRTLIWAGAQVYTVRKDEELAKALDSRTTRIHPLMV
ncbi:MAG TPA: DUF58 domain-containing protein [Dehalococcoidales bacterium]